MTAGQRAPEERGRQQKAVWLAAAIAAGLLVASGVGYRLLAAKLDLLASQKIALDPPLSALPVVLGAWHGEDVPLVQGLTLVERNDEYLNRRYTHATTGESLILYITYTARPRIMLGHRPQVCYPATGWIHEGTSEAEVRAADLEIPCLIHSFRMPSVDGRRQLVLNYYVLSGKLTTDENEFWGVRWRDPNLRRDTTHYVAQVQVAVPVGLDRAAAEETAKRFVATSAEGILSLLPGRTSQAASPTTVEEPANEG